MVGEDERNQGDYGTHDDTKRNPPNCALFGVSALSRDYLTRFDIPAPEQPFTLVPVSSRALCLE